MKKKIMVILIIGALVASGLYLFQRAEELPPPFLGTVENVGDLGLSEAEIGVLAAEAAQRFSFGYSAPDLYIMELEWVATDWLDNNLPGFRLITTRGHFGRPPLVVTHGFLNGKVYALPEEFNTLMRDAGLAILSSTQALGVADAYVKASELPPVIVLESAENIPQQIENVPPDIATQIQPPSTRQTGDGFAVELYTWSEVNGVLRRWTLTVRSNGEVSAQKELVASFVGDRELNTRYLPENSEGQELTLSSLGFQAAEENKLVTRTGRVWFNIRWRPDDFPGATRAERENRANVVVEMVESGLMNADRYLFDVFLFSDDGLTDPSFDSDNTVDVYLSGAINWGPANDAGTFHQVVVVGGRNEQVIYIQEDLVTWLANNFNIKYEDFPGENKTFAIATLHEFFHVIQVGYGGLQSAIYGRMWSTEGMARAIQAIVYPTFEFYLPQNPNQRTLYIRDIVDQYFTDPSQFLTLLSYCAALYWYYLGTQGVDIRTICEAAERENARTDQDLIDTIDSLLRARGKSFEEGFFDYAKANIKEFPPPSLVLPGERYPFDRDDQEYPFGDAYYGDLHIWDFTNLNLRDTPILSYPESRLWVVARSIIYLRISTANMLIYPPPGVGEFESPWNFRLKIDGDAGNVRAQLLWVEVQVEPLQLVVREERELSLNTWEGITSRLGHDDYLLAVANHGGGTEWFTITLEYVG
jgi:hypothetical protein